MREKPQPPVVPEAINVYWSMDFMHDQLSDGRNYRLLNVGVVEKRHLLLLKKPVSDARFDT